MVETVSKRHTIKTGDISEAHIIARLLTIGYEVLKPIGENHRYDLIIEDADGNLYRVQCKTEWIEGNGSVIEFATASGGQRGWKSYRGQVDYFAVYCQETEKSYLIPIGDVGRTNGKLRLTPTKNKQEKGVRWAKDYEL